MSRQLRAGWLPPTIGVAAVVAGAAAYTLLAYFSSPLVALMLPLAAAAAVGVLISPTFGIYAAVLAVPLEYLRFKAAGAASLSASDILLLLSGASAIGHMLFSDRRRHLAAPHVAFAALAATAATGIIFAAQSFAAAKIVVAWSLLLFLSVWVAGADRRELQRLLIVIAAAGGLVGLIAVLNGGTQELVAGGSQATGRAQAGFSQPNLLAFFLVLCVPLALVMGMAGPSRLRVPMLASAGLAFAALLLSLSRGGIIGTAIALLVLLLWTSFRRVFVGLLVLLAVFTALNANPLAKSREVSVVQQRLNSIVANRETTANPRIRIWAKTPSIVADHFVLGVGEGSYAAVSPRYGLVNDDGTPFEHAHNLFLTIAAETGLIGLAAFLWLVAAVARLALSALARRSSPDFPYALGLIAALAALFATGMTDYPLRDNVVLALVMLEIGALVAYGRLARDDLGLSSARRR